MKKKQIFLAGIVCLGMLVQANAQQTDFLNQGTSLHVSGIPALKEMKSKILDKEAQLQRVITSSRAHADQTAFIQEELQQMWQSYIELLTREIELTENLEIQKALQDELTEVQNRLTTIKPLN